MKFKRIVRDVSVLAAICGGFYLLTMTTNLLSNEPPVAKSDFSINRQMLDDSLNRKSYRESIVFLEKMLDEDPYNSHAWYWKGFCAEQLGEQLRKEGNQESAAEIEKFTELAISAFTKSLDFPRYSNLARFNLAVVFTQQGKKEEVISILREAVEDGFYTRRGLSNYDYFVEFEKNEDFKSIVALETRNARQYAKKKQGSLRIGM